MVKYIGYADYKHDTTPATGVLLANLGTPDAPTASALRRYLAEFLSDPRVIEMPRPVWWLILHGIILRVRPRRSAEAYKKTWKEDGSPILDTSRKQTAGIQKNLQGHFSGPIHVELAMRYGNPSIKTGLEKLRQANARRILVFPLYPQYCAATTASTFDAVTDILKTWRWIPEIRMINHYHDAPGYINALAESIQKHWQTEGKAEKLLFSFHGIPKDYFDAGDPYSCECQKTVRLVVEKLGLGEDEWLLTFQSRFGPKDWLQPYTDITLKEWGGKGIKSVNVICPGFPADCLETLEEIDMRNRSFFTEAGGETFSYIPALNDSPAHITALTDIIVHHCQDWL
jgi:ferrochelatase